MTNGEKTIWAVAYVQQLQEHHANTSPDHYDNLDKLREWEATGATMAAEHACWAVYCARSSLPRVKEVFGEDEDVYLMLLEMQTLDKE